MGGLLDFTGQDGLSGSRIIVNQGMPADAICVQHFRSIAATNSNVYATGYFRSSNVKLNGTAMASMTTRSFLVWSMVWA